MMPDNKIAEGVKELISAPIKIDLRIPQARSSYIDERLAWFKQLYLTASDWPLDGSKLVQKMKGREHIPFDYAFAQLSDEREVMTCHEKQRFLMQINASKIKKPFVINQHRYLNFSIAIEIGHIVLGHIPITKTPPAGLDQIRAQGFEASEFARRLLMPKELVFTCNYFSLEQVASYLHVPEKTLLERLTGLNRLHILERKPVPACPRCGNTSVHRHYPYCGICGKYHAGILKGIRKVTYGPKIPQDRYKRADRCPICDTDLQKVPGDACPLCRLCIFNDCSSYYEGDPCGHINPGNHRYCEVCGKPTYYFVKKVLRAWDESCELVPQNGEYADTYSSSPSVTP